MQFSNQKQSETMVSVSPHQLPEYYQQNNFYNGFKCFSHMIYTPQSDKYQNDAKLIIHCRIQEKPFKLHVYEFEGNLQKNVICVWRRIFL